MQIRFLVFSFVVTVAIELGIRKQKENIPQIYIQSQGHPPASLYGYVKYISLIYQFYF